MKKILGTRCDYHTQKKTRKIGWIGFEIEAQEHESACGPLKWIQNLVIIFSNKTSSSKRNHSLPSSLNKGDWPQPRRRWVVSVRLKELLSTHDEKNQEPNIFIIPFFLPSSSHLHSFFLHNINFKFAEQIDWLLIQPENDASCWCHSN